MLIAQSGFVVVNGFVFGIDDDDINIMMIASIDGLFNVMYEPQGANKISHFSSPSAESGGALTVG